MGVQAQGNWKFALQLNGLDRFLLDGITPPQVELPEIPQAAPGGLPDIMIPGKYKANELVIRKIKPHDQGDTWAWEWLARTVFGVNRALYAQSGILSELGPDGITPINNFYLGECWPKMINTDPYVGTGDGEKLIENVTLSIRWFFPIALPDFKVGFGV